VGGEVGPVGGGLIANEEAELGIDAFFSEIEQDDVLAADGTEAVPLIEGHFLDEDFFVSGGGLKFVDEVGDEMEELVAVFTGDDAGGAAESVGGSVAAGCGFSFVRARSRGLLGVGSIGVNLCFGGHK